MTPFNDTPLGAFARREDPETSKAAAGAVDTTALEARVVGALKRYGPMTTHELSGVTFIPLWSLSPRIRPLVAKGLVVDTGTTKKGSSGRHSVVWRAALPTDVVKPPEPKPFSDRATKLLEAHRAAVQAAHKWAMSLPGTDEFVRLDRANHLAAVKFERMLRELV